MNFMFFDLHHTNNSTQVREKQGTLAVQSDLYLNSI